MTFIIELSQKITATKVIFGVRSKIGIIIVAIYITLLQQQSF